MLFEQIIHPDRGDYRNVVLLQTDGPVSEKDLREALDIVARENEELRSAIVFRNVTTIQQVITDRRIPLEIIETEEFGSQQMQKLRDTLLHTPVDLQRDCMMRAVYLRAGEIYMLCLLTHRIAFSNAQRRAYLARLMDVLEERYPQDVSIRGWRELFEMNSPSEQKEEQRASANGMESRIKSKIPPEICVYSENKGPKLVFVHTANTGSSAYYRLAAWIGDQVSFSVIEPFNLYHTEEARYGIRSIAAKYIEILKRRQPEGPYLLGGWCYGGVVAQEMACQMEKAGEDVRLLILLDAHAIANEELRKISGE